jgi:hypothetical protein
MDAREAQRRAFELYADVVARLCHPLADRLAILYHASLDEVSFARLEDYCLVCLEVEARAGGRDLGAILGTYVGDARRRLRGGPRTEVVGAPKTRSPTLPTIPTVDIEDLMQTLAQSSPASRTRPASSEEPDTSEDPAAMMTTLQSPTEPKSGSGE